MTVSVLLGLLAVMFLLVLIEIAAYLGYRAGTQEARRSQEPQEPLGQREDSNALYYLDLDGHLLRSQRELLWKLSCNAHEQKLVAFASGDADLLEGLIQLTDTLADRLDAITSKQP